MSLLDVLRTGVKIADAITKPLQPEVSFERCTGSDGFGTLAYAEGIVPLRAIVEEKQKNVRTSSGELTISSVTVTLLDVDALVAATVGAGVQVQDRITLPDGRTGPILNTGGFVDAGTGRPIATEVYLG